jgi:hypothetical protein
MLIDGSTISIESRQTGYYLAPQYRNQKQPKIDKMIIFHLKQTFGAIASTRVSGTFLWTLPHARLPAHVGIGLCNSSLKMRETEEDRGVPATSVRNNVNCAFRVSSVVSSRVPSPGSPLFP